MPPTEPAVASLRPRRGLLRRVIGDTLARWGARIGAAWIGFLAVLAVFAPLIANSHPLLMKKDGAWSSPMVEHLGPMDVVLFVGFFAGLVIWLLPRLASGMRWLAFAAVIVLTTVPALIFVEEPDVIVYERYREWLEDEKVERVVMAPIPYSPSDRMRDRRIRVQLGPVAPSWAMRWWGVRWLPDTQRKLDEARAARAAAAEADDPETLAELDAQIEELTQQVQDYTKELSARIGYGHLLGQDQHRQDVASRMIHASRIALAIGFIATGIALAIGIVIGGLMGYFAALVDLIGMRLVEIFEFIPQLYLLLMFVAFFPGDYPEVIPGLPVQRIYMIMVIIGLTSWAGYARFIRAEFLKLRKQDFVTAARACGLPLRSILFRHMLPNGVTPVLVGASFGVASAILAEATLSFLGLGLIEEPSWGGLLNQATRGSTFLWWIAIFPGLAIFLTVFAYNLIGEALRDAIDPHTKRLQQA